MSHAQMMDANDGTARLWIDPQHRFAKLVRNGHTVARIDALTDGTTRATAGSERTEGMTWEAASAWITARATAEALVSGLEVLSRPERPFAGFVLDGRVRS